MARRWTRNPGDVAWNVDADEARLLLLAYVLARETFDTFPGWVRGFESHFVGRGAAVTDAAIVEFNYRLEALGLPPIRLQDEGEGRSFATQAEQQDDRQRALSHILHLPEEEVAPLYLDFHRLTCAPATVASCMPADGQGEAFDDTAALEPGSALDARTIRVLMDSAPDGTTQAWLGRFLASAEFATDLGAR